MATKIKAPLKPTGATVMAMFKNGITPSKGYAAKLSSLLNFLQLSSDIRVSAEVVEEGVNISEDGEVVPYEAMRRDFIDRKVSRLSFFASDERQLESKQSGINRERYECHKVLKSKAKSVTDKKREAATQKLSELEVSGNEVSHELAKLRGRIREMVDAERVKLEATEFTIQEMRRDQELSEGVRVKIDLKTGTYTFPIPTGNAYHREVFSLLGLSMAELVAEKPVIKRMFQFPADALKSLKKAIRFVSDDDLRPAMTHVLVEIRDGKMQVVATDAHRLYLSQSFEVSGAEGDYDYLIPAKAIGRLPKTCNDDFTMYHMKGDTVSMFGLEIPLLDARFPDYRVVMPKYESGVVLHRKDFIACVKQTLPFSNKSTAQVNIDINGALSFAAQDIDFSFQSGVRMAYKKKTMDDLLIAFNGKFLVDALSIFDTEDITLQAVSATKAGIISDGTETVLIMPLMINS